MGTLTQRTRAEIEQLVSQLTTLRDELRVRLHLAGMDAKERYEKLDDEIFELEQRAKRVTEEGAQEVRKRLAEAKKRLEHLRDRVVGV